MKNLAKNLSKLLLLILTAGIISGCGGTGLTNVTFNAAPNAGKTSGRIAQRTLESRSSISELDAVYGSLGTRLSVLTPTSFTLPLGFPLLTGMIDTGNGEELWDIPFQSAYNYTDAESLEDSMHVDFVADEPFMITAETWIGVYDSLVLNIDSCVLETSTFTGSETFNLTLEPYITVEIPGYTVAEWPDIEETDISTGDPTGRYFRQNLGGNTFRFMLYELLPDPVDEADVPYGQRSIRIGYYLLSSQCSAPEILVPDWGDSILLSDYGNVSPGIANASAPVLYLPMESIAVDEETTITFNIDVSDIISVYDSGTTDDKTDDVAILSNGFWDKFSLTTE